MKKLQNLLMDKLQISMTADQEADYISVCAKRVVRYAGIFLLVILAIQLYNIGYTLLYTKGRLNTVPSRVYMVLYVLLFLASLGCLGLSNYYKKHVTDNASQVVRLQFLYGAFLLFWSTCITAYDQRVSQNINVYLIMSMTVAVLVYFTPLQAILTYGIFLSILCWLIPVFSQEPRDNYGEYVNLTIVTLMCMLISIYHYCADRRNYLQRQIIIEKNTYLKGLANQDPLTGLRNRRFLEGKMDSLYQRYRTEKVPMTFMMLDIDFFKNYNDQYGHLQGDECLRRVSWRIKRELDEEHDYLIRYGGEEFLYIGIGIDEQAAESKGQYLNKVIRELVTGPSDREPMGITISIGSYTITWDKPEEHLEWTDCIAKADKALYMAKNSGRDKYVSISE